MKKIFITTMVLMAAFSAMACAADAEQTELTKTHDYDYGAAGASAVEDFTIEQMLNYAIEDEYLARKEYEIIMDEYGERRPFSMIIQAEESHIAQLKDIFEEYGYEIPEDNSADYVVLPDSLEEAYSVGVEAEIANIAMYEQFLSKDLPDDIREVFEALKYGSENHLRAFEKGGGGIGQRTRS